MYLPKIPVTKMPAPWQILQKASYILDLQPINSSQQDILIISHIPNTPSLIIVIQ